MGTFVWARRARKHQKRRFPARAVHEIDTDGDGAIDAAEFQARPPLLAEASAGAR